MKEEHTRIEVEKYALENGKDRADGEIPVGGAGFTLYPAKLDDAGNICYEEGKPLYEQDSPVAHWITDDGTMYRDFPEAFETMYLEHGAAPEAALCGMSEKLCIVQSLRLNAKRNRSIRPIRSRPCMYTERKRERESGSE